MDEDNRRSRDAWTANAAFWDERIGEGNRLVRDVLWPATERLLAPNSGEVLLDAACGNGLYARRLAAAGARVIAFDFSEALVERARAHGVPPGGALHYAVADATDGAAVAALSPPASLDGALCAMALMDMPVVRPLMDAVFALLRPGGRFVWSVMHPAFNQSRVSELPETPGAHQTRASAPSLCVRGYLSEIVAEGVAISGQPRPQPYFERPLSAYLRAGFDAGFVLDALEEPPAPPNDADPPRRARRRSEFPDVVVARLRKPAR
ncbi:MAG TPA: class I SAM-dependent methyltransferase [Dehalococcoidia bacterium]|nr:class I SAM-dependent methyltransferase [Dehalococcoidia bacterium]